MIVPIKDIDSAQSLDACLTSVQKQTYRRKEAVVISGVSPLIQHIARKHGTNIISVQTSKGGARNIGVAKSHGELIVHLDADMVMTKHVLADCVEKYKKGYNAIIIPEEIDSKGFLMECRRLEKQCYVGNSTIEAVRCISRNLHEHVGGFDETTGNIDEYAYHAKIERANCKITRINQPIIVNEPIINLHKKFKHGEYSRIYITKYPEKAKPQFSPLKRITQYSKIAKTKPLHFFTLLFLKSLELIAFITGSLIGNLTINKETEPGHPYNFDAVATTYEDVFSNTLGGKQLNELEKKTIRRMLKQAEQLKTLPESQNPVSIDLGAGTGRLSNTLLERGFYTIGLDNSRQMCKTTKNRYRNLNFEAIRADMTNLPIQPQKVAVALSFRSAKYVRNTQKIFNEVNRVLINRGLFLLELPNAFSPFYIMGKMLSSFARKMTRQPTIEYMSKVKLFTRNQYLNLIANSGMHPIAFESLFLAPQAISARQRSLTVLRMIAILEKIVISDLHMNSLSRSLLYLIAK